MSTFLSSFEGLWRRPSADYKNGVKNYRIALDTNVLLELYRFTPAARNELIDVLRQLKGRLWIPHQVAAEYYNRRVDAVKEHLALYESIPSKLEEQKTKALQELHAFAKRCSMDFAAKKQLTTPIEHAFSVVNKQIEEQRKAFDLSLERVINSDPVLAALGEIFDGKTGVPFDGDKENELLGEFQRRATEKIPPGYKDSNKPENPHGDFFVWEQLIAECAGESESLLFVTNDAKEDWVRREAGLIVGARPELVHEFRQRCGADFLITQLGRFLQVAKEELGASISESTVAQAENITTRQSIIQRSVIALPDEHFIELMKSVDAASKISDADMAQLSQERRLHITKAATEASRIANAITSSAKWNGGDVQFAIDSQDWDFAYHLWKNGQTEEVRRIEVAAQSSRVAQISQEWKLISQIERDLADLQDENKSLSGPVAPAQRADVTRRRAHIQAVISKLELDLEAAISRVRSISDAD
ncbi:PIN domain-containing protein [Streptomyces sp. NPDC003435]